MVSIETIALVILRPTWDHMCAFLVLIKYEVLDLQLGCMKKRKEKPGDPEHTGFSLQKKELDFPLLTTRVSLPQFWL